MRGEIQCLVWGFQAVHNGVGPTGDFLTPNPGLFLSVFSPVASATSCGYKKALMRIRQGTEFNNSKYVNKQRKKEEEERRARAGKELEK